MQQPPKKLLDQVRESIRLKHYSYRTEESYVYWIGRYILFHNKQHPKDLSSEEIEAFLTHLAVDEQVAASTQNQAMLPTYLIDPLKDYLQSIKRLHQQDLEKGYGSVYLPFALERKYPSAMRDWRWQFVFPSDRLSKDPRSGTVRRHHLHESGLQKAVKQAVHAVGIEKRVSCSPSVTVLPPIFCKMAMTSA